MRSRGSNVFVRRSEGDFHKINDKHLSKYYLVLPTERKMLNDIVL